MTDTAKAVAGAAAADLVEDGMRLGLGSGSTVAYFLDALAVRGLDVVGIPTSDGTAARCRELGIALADTAELDRLDLAVDGADEFDPDLALTKGGGGALLREKVVASMAERFVVVATPDKRVARLGDSFSVPVEVVPFAVPVVRRQIQALGFEVTVRGGGGYRTDNGNAILDCRLPGGIQDPVAADDSLQRLPGVAETGLFLEMADLVLAGRDDGEVEHHRPQAGDGPPPTG